MKQTTNTIMMVRPSYFGWNAETAKNNFFQKNEGNVLPATILAKAQEEFDLFVSNLRSHGVEVIVLEDNSESPDAIFPNNWISFHQNGDVGIYPMFAENRRKEKREDVLDLLEEKGFHIENVVDYSEAEFDDIFLEGTGSFILDRVNKIAYACISQRTDEDLFIDFCEDFGYLPVIFYAYQNYNGAKHEIYHTNVMMSVADSFAIVCLESIKAKKEKKLVTSQLKDSGKEIISITEKQMHHLAGNVIQVEGENGEKFLVMSQQAKDSLTKNQINSIEKHCEILASPLDTIEYYGGGGARCMIAEVFLPRK
ncbi:citrulline utilization hydrolase CtlX [Aureivirga sp. CE67]|uniref:citrulline utilization hydrolase CtlX n=1 Tax=Aureivirga sp. CE67 TaxID=1788983 RepID=UPI0018CA8ABF|nr:arginine deiminase-related protein [Aureivirga sp. CE67]